MKKLTTTIALLVVVLAFFYNIERLDIGDENAINMQSFVYGLGTIAVLSMLLVPQFRRARAFIAVLIWVAVYFLFKVLLFDSRPLVGDGLVYLTIAELTFLVVLVLVSHLVGQELAGFERGVEQLTLAENGYQLKDLNSGWEAIKAEITRSRYYERPISVLVISTESTSMSNRVDQMILEMQQKFTHLYDKVRVARLVRKELQLMDQIYLDRQNDRLIVVCPELDRETAALLAEQVRSVIEQDGIEAKIGWASFPEDGLTFDGLLTHSQASVGH